MVDAGRRRRLDGPTRPNAEPPCRADHSSTDTTGVPPVRRRRPDPPTDQPPWTSHRGLESVKRTAQEQHACGRRGRDRWPPRQPAPGPGTSAETLRRHRAELAPQFPVPLRDPQGARPTRRATPRRAVSTTRLPFVGPSCRGRCRRSPPPSRQLPVPPATTVAIATPDAGARCDEAVLSAPHGVPVTPRAISACSGAPRAAAPRERRADPGRLCGQVVRVGAHGSRRRAGRGSRRGGANPGDGNRLAGERLLAHVTVAVRVTSAPWWSPCSR